MMQVVAWRAAFLQPRARATGWIRSQRSTVNLLTRAYSHATKQHALYPASVASSQLLYSVSLAPDHRLLGHVEQPSRVETVLEALKVAGITNSSSKVGAVWRVWQAGSACVVGRYRR